MGKFFEDEQPELVVVKGSELRLYNKGQRLAVSKPQWSNDSGVHMGKTVSIDLASNAENQQLIGLLKQTIEILEQ